MPILGDLAVLNVDGLITDAVGSAEYNLRLSERRAQSVRQYLMAQHGIDPSRLTAQSFGSSRLLLPNAPANEANRRVEFKNPSYHTAAAAPVSPPMVSSAGPTPQPVQPTTEAMQPTTEATGL